MLDRPKRPLQRRTGHGWNQMSHRFHGHQMVGCFFPLGRGTLLRGEAVVLLGPLSARGSR